MGLYRLWNGMHGVILGAQNQELSIEETKLTATASHDCDIISALL